MSASQGSVRPGSAHKSPASQPPAGWVALVGAGPGDGGLLTVRGAELLGQAGLVVAGTDLAAVTAERSLLEALAAGCSAPVGAYAEGAEPLRMRVAVMSTDGTRMLRAHGSASGADARRLGRDLAAELLGRGASDLISGQQGQGEQQE